MRFRILVLTARSHEPPTLLRRSKPVEREVAVIETRDRVDAYRELARGIAEGRFPAGSRLEEVPT